MFVSDRRRRTEMEENMEIFKNKLIVHGLMVIDEKYIVIKRGKPNVFPKYWDIPGGSVEDYETPVEALVREIKEEVGLDVNIKQIIHEDSNYDKSKNIMFTRLVYKCSLKETGCLPIIKLDPEEHTEYRLISSLEDLNAEKIVPFLADIILDKQ